MFNHYNCLEIERLKERDEVIRESWVKAMEARIVRDNLQKGDRTEGVNHMETCKHLADRYIDMIKDNRVRRSLPLVLVYCTRGN